MQILGKKSDCPIKNRAAEVSKLIPISFPKPNIPAAIELIYRQAEIAAENFEIDFSLRPENLETFHILHSSKQLPLEILPRHHTSFAEYLVKLNRRCQ